MIGVMAPSVDERDLALRPMAAGTVELLEGLATTRAIRRYRDEPVPTDVLRDILFAATRAPSGSNGQPFRFVVLSDGPRARAAKALIGDSARQLWGGKRAAENYAGGSGTDETSPKARLARAMAEYVEDFERVPVVILACLVRHRPPSPTEGASVYPACQNLLLAARGLGYGGVMTGWHAPVEDRLRELLGIPEQVAVSATLTLGRPKGRHGPVRRRPLGELVSVDGWDRPAPWAVDPPATAYSGRHPTR